MDNTALAGVSQGLIAYLPLGLPLGIAVLFVWVVLRTESWHLLRRRLWQVIHGKGEITDTGIRAFIEEQTNLAAFRVFVGPNASTLAEARALMAWCAARGVDLGALRRCGAYFDAGKRHVTRGERFLTGGYWFWAIAYVLCASVAVPSLALVPTTHAWLTLRSSGQHFLASESGIRTTWPPLFASSFARSDCEAPQQVAVRMSFSNEDVSTLCQLLDKEEYAAFVRKSLSNQRWTLFFLAVIAAGCAYFAALSAVRCGSARRLLRRRLDPTLPSPQLTLDLGDPT